MSFLHYTKVNLISFVIGGTIEYIFIKAGYYERLADQEARNFAETFELRKQKIKDLGSSISSNDYSGNSGIPENDSKRY